MHVGQTALENLNLCGCGSGLDMEIVLLVLHRAKMRELTMYAPAEDASGRWVEFAAKFLDGADFLDHGTGIGSAWLTETGEAALSFLTEHGTDVMKWPVRSY